MRTIDLSPLPLVLETNRRPLPVTTQLGIEFWDESCRLGAKRKNSFDYSAGHEASVVDFIESALWALNACARKSPGEPVRMVFLDASGYWYMRVIDGSAELALNDTEWLGHPAPAWDVLVALSARLKEEFNRGIVEGRIPRKSFRTPFFSFPEDAA
jgi:hypothetical protein